MFKLYICSHIDNRDIIDISNKYNFLLPLQVGTNQNYKFDNYNYDDYDNHHDNDDNDNISHLNKYYCELTGHFWAYKNETANYYGFCHYRRFFDFSLNSNKIYSFQKNVSNLSLDKFNYKQATQIIQDYDIILPKKEKIYTNVYNQYKNSKNHYISDLDLIIDIINKIYPEFNSATNEYLNGYDFYVGNMFIMNNQHFQNYSKWLFDILFQFDVQSINKSLRVNGFLAERLLGIYITYLQNNQNIKILELPRIHIETDIFLYYKKIITNFVLPPSSKRRLLLRKIKGN